MARGKRNRKDKMAQRTSKRAVTGGGNTGGSYVQLPSGIKLFKPENGKNFMSIIPYKTTIKNKVDNVPKGEMNYVRTVYAHFNVGPEEKAVLCPTTFGNPCPICEERKKMQQDESHDEDAIKLLSRKHRELYNVLNEEGEVEVFNSSHWLFGRHLEEELREGDEDWAYFACVEDGYSLSVRFTEKTLGKTKFLEASRIDFNERETLTADVLKKAVDLDATLQVKTYEEVYNMFMGLDDEIEEVVETPKEEPKEEVKEEVVETTKEEPKEEVVEKKTTASALKSTLLKTGTKVEWSDEDDEGAYTVSGVVVGVDIEPEEGAKEEGQVFYEVEDDTDKDIWELEHAELKVVSKRKKRG